MLGFGLGIGFLEHEVEVVQFLFVEDEMDGVAGSGQDDRADKGVGFWVKGLFFVGYYSEEGLEVVGVERENGGSEGYLEVMTFFAFNDIAVGPGVTVCEMAHA